MDRQVPPAVSARDAGLALIARINRWLIAGAITLTGVISIAAAKAFHGRTVSTSAATSAPSQPASQSQPSTSSNTGSGNTGSGNTGSGNTGSGNTGSGNTGSGNTGSGLQQPASAPAPAPAPSPAVSGGS
jgi:hypothetical protein